MIKLVADWFEVIEFVKPVVKIDEIIKPAFVLPGLLPGPCLPGPEARL